jgi:hypothetical protein
MCVVSGHTTIELVNFPTQRANFSRHDSTAAARP